MALLLLLLLYPAASFTSERQPLRSSPLAYKLDCDYFGARYDATLVEPRVSVACGGGLGIFALRDIAPGQRLASIPLDCCVTAEAASKVIGCDYDAGMESQRVATRALLAYLRFGGEETALGAYVDSLPWPLDSSRPEPRAEKVALLAGVTPREAQSAVDLLRSRSMDLGTSADDPRRLHAMVPFADLFNHPSLSVLNEYQRLEDFKKDSLFESCVRWYLNTERTEVLVDAPLNCVTKAEQELFLWYGDAGFYKDKNDGGALKWDSREHSRFVSAYGFDPWAEVQQLQSDDVAAL